MFDYSKKTLIFFDTETTGLPPKNDPNNFEAVRLVQLGYIVTDGNGKILHEENNIVYPDGFVVPEIPAKIHGITTDIAKEKGEPVGEVMDKFEHYLRMSDAVICHNWWYDSGVVDNEFTRLKMKEATALLMLHNPICTKEQSTDYCKIPFKRKNGRNGDGKYKFPSLKELHIFLFGEDFEGAHDAMNDVKATMRCFFELVKLGVITL